MKQENLTITALKQALGVTIYVLLVGTVMSFGNEIFGTKPNLLGPVAFLMLFVISAAITGYLVVGKSILMYLDGAKKSAVQLFGLTILWLFLFMMLAFLGMIVF